jgi:hypothetical protein
VRRHAEGVKDAGVRGRSSRCRSSGWRVRNEQSLLPRRSARSVLRRSRSLSPPVTWGHFTPTVSIRIALRVTRSFFPARQARPICTTSSALRSPIRARQTGRFATVLTTVRGLTARTAMPTSPRIGFLRYTSMTWPSSPPVRLVRTTRLTGGSQAPLGPSRPTSAQWPASPPVDRRRSTARRCTAMTARAAFRHPRRAPRRPRPAGRTS